jgi:hypothetical protein
VVSGNDFSSPDPKPLLKAERDKHLKKLISRVEGNLVECLKLRPIKTYRPNNIGGIYEFKVLL